VKLTSLAVHPVKGLAHLPEPFFVTVSRLLDAGTEGVPGPVERHVVGIGELAELPGHALEFALWAT
jgi:hypothetical protein